MNKTGISPELRDTVYAYIYQVKQVYNVYVSAGEYIYRHDIHINTVLRELTYVHQDRSTRIYYMSFGYNTNIIKYSISQIDS